MTSKDKSKNTEWFCATRLVTDLIYHLRHAPNKVLTYNNWSFGSTHLRRHTIGCNETGVGSSANAKPTDQLFVLPGASVPTKQETSAKYRDKDPIDIVAADGLIDSAQASIHQVLTGASKKCWTWSYNACHKCGYVAIIHKNELAILEMETSVEVWDGGIMTELCTQQHSQSRRKINTTHFITKDGDLKECVQGHKSSVQMYITLEPTYRILPDQISCITTMLKLAISFPTRTTTD